jgi:hypothetical protein
MVNNGINAWLVSTAESIISFAEGETNATATATATRSPGQMVLFRMIAYSYDPFENPGVIKTIQSTGIIFLFLFVIFVFSGLAFMSRDLPQ